MRRALLSVTDKQGITEFAQGLVDAGFALLSTGGTRRAIADAGVEVQEVADYTGFPEMMDGRVKTLHPKVHGGLLARRDDEAHVAAIEADSGSFAPRGFGIGAVDADVAALQPYAMLFSELGADTFTRGGGGADIAPLVRAGVLGIAVRPEGNEYFDLHHSPADTVDKVDPGHLQRNAMAMALMAFILAERDLPEGTAPVVPAADRPPPAIDPTTTPPASAPTPAPTSAPKKR